MTDLEQKWGKVLAAKMYRIKASPKLKSGEVIPVGTQAFLSFPSSSTTALTMDLVGQDGRNYKFKPLILQTSSLWQYVAGISKPPGISALERMSDNAVATTPTGFRVEPDGQGPDGSHSWMVVLGYM